MLAKPKACNTMTENSCFRPETLCAQELPPQALQSLGELLAGLHSNHGNTVKRYHGYEMLGYSIYDFFSRRSNINFEFVVFDVFV